MKELYREKDVVGNIDAIKFGFMDSAEIEQISHLKVEQSVLYVAEETGKPHPLGALSRHMGTSLKDVTCTTCGKLSEDCPGHYGYVDLNLPVYHWGYFKNIVQIMQDICKSCARLLLTPERIAQFVDQTRHIKNDYLKKKATIKRVNELCKKNRKCPHCGEMNGVVKKLAPMKITHERFRGAKKEDQAKSQYLKQYDALLEQVPDAGALVTANPIEVFYPDDVLRLFNKMEPLDLVVLCLDQECSHPRDFILTRLLIAPNCVRPSVVSDLKKPGSNEDDITAMVSLIVFLNNLIAKRVSARKLDSLHEAWEQLQLHVALLINSEIALPPELCTNRKQQTGFVQRLKGKQGRFRGNLSGKRVDFSSRTVISPDPNLKIDQVGVPVEVAKILTYPEQVNDHNINLMRQLIMNGPDIHPGALYFETKSGTKKSLRMLHKRKHEVAQNLRVGDKVERHLMDGDIVLFNRQPSLHKMSIMAHHAKVLPWRTFRFNECVCGPYNADFDGDEMNLHLPQTEEARGEAMSLMGVTNNLVTPRSGSLIIGATQDFITGSYLLTKKDKFFDRAGACRLIMVIAEPTEAIELPKPAIMKPMELWTGKQLFSLVLRPNKKSRVMCNLFVNKCKDRSCTFPNDELCDSDNVVLVRNSELLAGVLDKGLLGAGSKKNIFYVILKDYGKDEAAEAMWRVARISIQFLLMYGFTIGIGDLSPSPALLEMKEALLDKGYSECKRFIKQLEDGQLECAPGCNAEESLEQVILSELSKIRESAGRGCIEELQRNNAALIMAVSGSKGSIINISQMIACVGQQAINGKRVPNGFTNRSLPYYKHHSKLPEAKGFVSNSFFSGLTPSEFLFHTMGGREGLVDTAVKTAETGYMQRRLVKCLEDLYVAYDGTVRNSTQDVIQFKYGDDGLDPSNIENAPCAVDGKISPPLDFTRILYHTKAVISTPANPEFIPSENLVSLVKSYLDEIDGTQRFSDLSETFKQSIIDFMQGESTKMAEAEVFQRKYNLVRPLHTITFEQMVGFVNTLVNRYVGSSVETDTTENTDSPSAKLEAGPGILVEPGTGVGALCAQSIGEPATQMTLKTFHFAGVAAMNITLGVPRIKEIINATKCISTPIITAQLFSNTDAHKARQVKARIEKTLLGEICEFIKLVSRPDDMYYVIKLSCDHINLLQLKVSAESVKYSICTSKMKVRESDITVESKTLLTVRPNYSSREDPYHQMQDIIKHLPKVIVKGLPTISRAVIHQREYRAGEDRSSGPVYELLVEGDNLREVIATYGVDGTKCTSNNIIEVATTLGIEAARQTIINEITHTMSSHGLSVDCRHVSLLADLMTCRGAVHGITRHGLAKIKESVLMLASFEKTADHLFEAAYHGQVNYINGVSDCIIMGKPINLGTGLFKLVQQHSRSDQVPDYLKLSSSGLDGPEAAQRSATAGSSATASSSSSNISARLAAAVSPRSLIFDVPEFHIPLYNGGSARAASR